MEGSKVYAVITSIFVAATLVIAFVIAYCLALPALTLRSPGFWCFLIITLVLVLHTVRVWMEYDFEDFFSDALDWSVPFFTVSLIVIGILILLFIILGIGSSSLFTASRAYQVADVTIEETGVAEVFPDLMDPENLETLPLVDLDTAQMLGDKKLAALANASWYDVDDEYNLIKYRGKYYRLSVIDYGGFFKYSKAQAEGLPGYVLVEVTPKDGTITQEASILTTDGSINYSPGAYFSYDLRRHLRMQYPTYMFDQSYLEIDESGVPYWVTGIYRPTAGAFGVMTVSSFILTNAQSGDSQEYKVEEAPEWVDHVFSLKYLMRVAEWHYAFKNGFWNSIFGQTNVWRTSYSYRDSDTHKADQGDYAHFFGYSSIVSPSGEVMFYTGLTAANKADSNLGWLTIDCSSGKMTQYDIVGAEEGSAQNIVEQLVQAQRYEATFPLPVNIGGQASYIMCLKGKAGLVQGYGICNVENYSIAVEADTLEEAIRQYYAKLGGKVDDDSLLPAEDPATDDGSATSDGTATSDGPAASGGSATSDGLTASGGLAAETEGPDDAIPATQIGATGTIEAVYTAIIDGRTCFYYILDGDEALYQCSITVNEWQVTYQVGDTVYLVYFENPEGEDSIRSVSEIRKN